MRVVATAPGFYGNRQIKAGDEFDMDESHMKRDGAGKPVLPTWVKKPEEQSPGFWRRYFRS